jgi:hypothetical protein
VPFDQQTTIADNERLRIPQREGWVHIRDHFQRAGVPREAGIVLPVGCGKSGLIAIAPYAVGARRALVIAPGTRIRGQLGNDLRANSPTNFYERCRILPAQAMGDRGKPTARICPDDSYADFSVRCHVRPPISAYFSVAQARS